MKRLFWLLPLLFSFYVTAARGDQDRDSFEERGNRIYNDGVEVAAIETLPKGTPLFHWGRLEKEKVEAIRQDGGISKNWAEEIARNGTGGGNGSDLGNGFYISLDPMDSLRFGNVAFVITLDHDIKTAKFHSSIQQYMFQTFAAEFKISAMTLRNGAPWYNVIEPEVIQKQTVPTAEEYVEKYLSKMPLLPSLKDLSNLAEWTQYQSSNEKNYHYDPPINQGKQFKKLQKKIIHLIEAMKHPGPESQKAFNTLIKNGSYELQIEAFTTLKNRTDPQAIRFLIDIALNPNFRMGPYYYVDTNKKFNDYYDFFKELIPKVDYGGASQIFRLLKEFNEFPNELLQKFQTNENSSVRDHADFIFKDIHGNKILGCIGLF